MKFKVYHATNPTFSVPSILTIEDYTLVAVVTCDSLDYVFELTNTIDHVWWRNPEVECPHATGLTDPLGLFKCRSTSVGDLVQNENGDFFFCDYAGWKKVF